MSATLHVVPRDDLVEHDCTTGEASRKVGTTTYISVPGPVPVIRALRWACSCPRRVPAFELRSPCPGCRTIDLHFMRGGVSRAACDCRLIGRGCQSCGRQWHERLAE